MKKQLALALLVGTSYATFAHADEKADCIAASEKAQQQRDDHKLISARGQFLTCARDACPAAIKKDCADQVSEIDKRTPTVVVRAKDKKGQDLVAVKVTSDGVVLTEQLDGHATPLDPGVHTFRFEAAGNDPIEQKVVLAEGEHDRSVTASFGTGGVEIGTGGVGGGAGGMTGSGKKGAPVAAFIIGGVGIVAMGVGGVFYGLGFSQKGTDESSTGCKNTGGCSSSEVDSIRSKLVVGDIAFYGGVALAAVGIVWAIVHYAGGGKESPTAARFDFGPTTLGRGAVASTTIRW